MAKKYRVMSANRGKAKELRMLTLLKFASISKYWRPFCTNVIRAPGGTKLPSMGHLLILASYPKANAECVNPTRSRQGKVKSPEKCLI